MGEGEILLEWTPKDEWGYPLPDSVSEFTYNKVCEEHQENYVSLEVKKSGVLYVGQRNGKLGFYKEKWEGVETEENIDNIKYEGEIKNGSPNGQGTLTWSNGTKYEGEVKEGFRNGQGTSTWKDGRKYEGEYKDGLPNGQGTLTLTDGTKYDGEWKDGKETGQGTLTFPDGEKYVGEWKDENPWNGTQYDKDGNILGKKVNGKWIKQ